jgi:acetyltransferase-like isoleucine patch superfamily enzyme
MARVKIASKFSTLGERLFNNYVTHIPSHTIRQAWLRFFGAEIGRGTAILMGTTVRNLHRIKIGDNCSIGFRVLIAAGGGVVIEHDTVIASEVQIITGRHIVDSDDFGTEFAPIHICHHAWISSRATILQGVTVGVGGVVGACALANRDVDDMTIVAGIPAKVVGKRTSSLSYSGKFRPILY